MLKKYYIKNLNKINEYYQLLTQLKKSKES